MAERLVYEAELDAEGVEKGVKTIVTSVEAGAKGVDEAMGQASKSVDQVTTSVDKAGKEAKEFGQIAEKGGKKVQKTMSTVKKDVGKVDKGLQDTSKSTSGLTNQLDKMSGGAVTGFRNFASGLKTGVKGLTTFKGALAATGIGLIVVAIGTLVQYFTNTERGAQKLRKITAVLGAVMDKLGDVAVYIGEALFNAFSNPKEAVLSLWETIKTNIVNRLEGFLEFLPAIGRAIKQVFEGDFEGAAKTAADAVGKVTLGVESITDTMAEAAKAAGEYAAEMARVAKAAEDLANRENALKVAEREFISVRAETNKLIAENRLLVVDESLAYGDRIAALDEAIAAEERTLAKELEFARERAAILAEKAALAESDEETLQAVAEAQAAVIELETRSLKTQKRLEAERQSILKQRDAQQKQAEQQAEKTAQAVEAMQRKFQAERLDGHEKAQQALKMELQARKDAIAKMEVDEETKNRLLEEAEASHLFKLEELNAKHEEKLAAEDEKREADEAKKKKLVEDALRTDKENELLAVQEEYAELLALAEQYGYDTAELLAQQKAAEGAIEDKYRKEQDAADEADAAKRIQRRQNVVAQANSLIQAGAQFALALMESGDEQDEKTAERRFKRGKQIQMAAAVASTASAVIAALAAPPVGLGFPAGIPGAATAALSGGVQIATIARQKYEPTAGGANTPLPRPPALNVGSGGGGGGGAGQGDVPADFIIPDVGNLTEEGDVTVEPLRAYVVSQEVTDTQQAETLIENQAQL